MNKLTATALACSLAFTAAGVLAADDTVSDIAIKSLMNHEVTAQEGTQSDAQDYHGMAAEPMKDEPASADSMSEQQMTDEPMSHDSMADDGARNSTEQ
ncbi:hypothetical protein OR16_11698 [Cupriavidus basilensis OR16]|uniref:Uncharacterized protein n=1 Tax=Cupriavidus basilensis OR16 TaxID=1127483 RepID=H1S3L1_9BURK|nr:hypothetical protein [Cupriavidus basilensis]EHP42912.1 hypothetical protein OR16_11698 [Cupriavidus basilensis OR16]